MPRDAEMTAAPVILANLTALTAEALPPVEAVLARAKDAVRDLVTVDGKISGAAIEAEQTAAHGLAWLATYVEALRQMQTWNTYGLLTASKKA